jgi:hypothetical protein
LLQWFSFQLPADIACSSTDSGYAACQLSKEGTMRHG